MYLTRFGVKNYKCLGEIDIPLTPIHVLIGENDSGKTSLIEAMNAFYSSSEGTLESAFKSPWEGEDLIYHRSSDNKIYLQGEWGDKDSKSKLNIKYKYGFEVEFASVGRDARIMKEDGEYEGEYIGLPIHHPSITSIASSKKDPKIREQLRKSNFTIEEFLKPALKLSFDPKTMAVPAAIDPERKFCLESDGFGLATLLDDILGFDFNIYSKLQEVFCNYFPQFRGIKLESEKAIRRSYQASGIHTDSSNIGKGIYFETRSGKKIRAQQASDGAILFLGFIAIAHLPDPPTMLLIEEPENGIYPKRLEEVIKLLKHLIEGNGGIKFPQIVMTTHSPYVLSFFEPEEVTFLSRPPNDPDGPVRARPLNDAPNIKERLGGEFYLGELWYNLSEEDLFGAP